ncbi:MAG: hypothetical protein LBU39_11990 [Desulfobulbaceae bacterium]|jgi:hypothetical protein|nr:hypothetical protein [Desulfobulbaceae bacterium]
MSTALSPQVAAFLADWPDEPMRALFQNLAELVFGLPDVACKFVARPGVSYSLRPRHTAQKERALFAMIDVIDDQPRWLSVCFYQDMVRDPEAIGDLVPGGLADSDGYCFDLTETDRFDYVRARLLEAFQAAGGQ